MLPLLKITKNFLIIFFFFEFYAFNAKGEILEKEYKNILSSTNNPFKEYIPTTNIKGSLFFTLGALESDYLHFTYENKIRLQSSFNGEDKLLTIIESGNAFKSPLNLDLQSKKGVASKISTILYQFKVSDDMQAIIGPKMFGYNGLAGKSSDYNERIAILDGSNYTTASGVGPGIGISINKKNGLNSTIKIASNDSIIDEKSTHFISQVGLTKKTFGGTITSNINDKFTAYGIAVFHKPKKFPSISASIEFKNKMSKPEIKNWILALQKNIQNKKIGLAVGTYNSEEDIAYESWSEITISDSFKIIPIVFLREKNSKDSEFGLALNTKFTY